MQTTTLEQSLRLKELGLSQKIEHGNYYYLSSPTQNLENELVFCFRSDDTKILFASTDNSGLVYEFRFQDDSVKALDGSHVDDLLPVFLNDGAYELQLGFKNDLYNCNYWSFTARPYFGKSSTGKTKLEAKTSLLIKLIKNGLVKV